MFVSSDPHAQNEHALSINTQFTAYYPQSKWDNSFVILLSHTRTIPSASPETIKSFLLYYI